MCAFPLSERVLAEEDGRDVPRFPAFPDLGEKFLAADAGHLERDGDEIGFLSLMNVQHIVCRGCGKDPDIVASEKTAICKQAFHGVRQQHFLSVCPGRFPCGHGS